MNDELNEKLVDILINDATVSEEDAPDIIDKLSSTDIDPEDFTDTELEISKQSIINPEKYEGENAFKAYLKDILSTGEKPMSLEDEVKIFKEIKKGNSVMREKLIVSNLRLVVHCAMKYTSRGVSLEDLVQEGNCGLIVAVDKFDYKKGYKFSTYATWWILQKIRKSILDKNRIVKIPAHMLYKIKAYNVARDKFFNEHGRDPSLEEITKITGLSESTCRCILGMPKIIDIKSDYKGQDSVEDYMSEHVESEDSKIENILEIKILKDVMKKYLHTLPEREQTVLTLYFYKNLSMPEIGNCMGVTREAIRQVLLSGCRRLSKYKELKDFFIYE